MAIDSDECDAALPDSKRPKIATESKAHSEQQPDPDQEPLVPAHGNSSDAPTSSPPNRPPNRPVNGGKPVSGGNARSRADTAPPPKARRLQGSPVKEPPSRPLGGDTALDAGAPLAYQSCGGSTVDSHGEAWPDFLSRAAAVSQGAGQTPGALFEAFRVSADLGVVYACFAQLFNLAAASHRDQNGDPVPPWAGPAQVPGLPWHFPYEAIRVLLGGNWKAKQLWDKLDKRCARSAYADAPCSSGRFAGKSAVVVGAGPCGLRAAIELRLLGARTTLIEKRTEFSRINQLHLWNWCGDELKDLGARCLEPPGSDFGANPDLLHVGIADLQTLLFKTALLLGVEVLLGTEFVGQQWREGMWFVDMRKGRDGFSGGACAHVPGGGSATTGPTPLMAQSHGPSPSAPQSMSHIAAIIGSDGLGCNVCQSVGMEVDEVGSLRSEQAIGLVCNFVPTGSSNERTLRSFALARQFFGALFRELETATGVELQNIVYTKGKNSHYFVMTPSRKCLVEKSVILDSSFKPLLAKENIDKNALDSLVRQVAAFRFKAEEPTLHEVASDSGNSNAVLQYADSGPQLFDFSRLQRMAEGVTFLDPAQGVVSEGTDSKLLVAAVGDALLEPFWPEGLGIVRGFFSALDAGSAISLWASGATCEATMQHFAAAYTELKSLCAQTRTSVLRTEEANYGLDPCSRYKSLSATLGQSNAIGIAAG